MSFSLIFNKFKSLAPLLVIVSSVAITVKLLTSQVSLNQEELKISAEEDINIVSYEDQIEIPPEPKQEQPQEEEEKKEEIEEDSEETEEEEGDGEEEQEESQEQETQQQKQDEQPTSKRKFVSNGIGGILGKIFNSKNKG